jgi:hypothetical protein
VPAVAAVAALAVGVLLVTGRRLVRSGPARVARALPPVLVASLLVVAGHLGTFLLAARAAGVHGSFLPLLPLGLVVLLGAAVPLNVGGWGPREGAAAWVFAAAGWGAGTGAAVATAFGVLTLAAVLPGAAVLLAGRRSPVALTGGIARG